MSLGLDSRLIARLTDSLAEALATVTVRHRRFPSSLESFLIPERALPQTGKLRALLEQRIGDQPFVSFSQESFLRKIEESQEYDADDTAVALATLPGFEDLRSLAEQLVADFESLPWEYSVSLALPQAFSEVFCEHVRKQSISPSITLVTPDDAFEHEFSLESKIEKLADLFGENNLKWEKAAYLQLRATGFIGKYVHGPTYAEAMTLVRSFCGLGIALGLFKAGRQYRHWYPDFQLRTKVLIHRYLNGQWKMQHAQELSGVHSRVLQNLELYDFDGKLATVAEKVAWMRNCLERISQVFSFGDRAAKVILATQWLFDSYGDDDELLSFVRTAVAMEILLGDKATSDLMSLGALLANRCAYLIADSQSQRDRILKEFRGIYEVRSSIVHQGKSRLDLRERLLFNKLRWMCQRVIQKEVDLLKKEDKPK